MKKINLILFTLFFIQATGQEIILFKKDTKSFQLIGDQKNLELVIDSNDDWLIQKTASFLSNDFEKVTQHKIAIHANLKSTLNNVIIIGTINNSAIIKKLIEDHKMNVDDIKSQWEAYKIVVVNNPCTGLDKAVVIVGSDKRGAAFGALEISKQIGVSPWYWWADVPIVQRDKIFIPYNLNVKSQPKVKYRGFFINDEAPALSNWSKEKFGGFNHFFYENVFELLLRLKSNYLWPAMWGNAFSDDDPLNAEIADKYGIVISNSHHEPMLRAQQEWKRYGKGPWNYQTNDSTLRAFWKKGIENMGTHESVISMGMRGDGDMPMTQGSNIALLERIITDQRKIIQEVTKKQVTTVPQFWALYKEVQDYYDKGMKVPDDVTLLLCDDNWGNIRKLPLLKDSTRKGGYGIYYHFDYVGGPRNYKWLNTNQIARVWEQMHLAYEYNVNKIWVVNVGDIKPMELPISFFLEHAWDPTKWNASNIDDYHSKWAKEQFGEKYAKEIGYLLSKYTQYNARRKPELLSPETYSISNYNEANRVVQQYNELKKRAEKINANLPAEYKDAFYQLVLYPIQVCANLNELYLAVAKNKEAYLNKNEYVNYFALKAEDLYKKDSLSTLQFHEFKAGKWNHMMSQTHIGYTYWQQPNKNSMPLVQKIEGAAIIKPNENKVANDQPQNVKRSQNEWVENNKTISIEASHYSNKLNDKYVQWQVIKNIGRDGDGVSVFPVIADRKNIQKNSPHLEYNINTSSKDSGKIYLYFSPTLNFHKATDGLQYAISVDEQTPQVFSLNKEDNNLKTWEQWVADNIIIKKSTHFFAQPGKHVIKFWMIDTGIILQKIVTDFGGLQASYLGPQESKK